MTQDDKNNVSFLNEFQLEGKKTNAAKINAATGKFAEEDWESALEITTKIATPERKKNFYDTDWDNIPRYEMKAYCLYCRKIITPEIKMIRRKPKKTCPDCKSLKIASGREDALIKFYHINDRD